MTSPLQKETLNFKAASKFLYWIPAILYMALIFWLSSLPAPEAVKDVPLIYKLKIVHMVEYGILSALFWLAVSKTTRLNRTETAALAAMMTVLYGATDELHQAFVPLRSACVIDIVSNGIGAAIVQLGILFAGRGAKG